MIFSRIAAQIFISISSMCTPSHSLPPSKHKVTLKMCLSHTMSNCDCARALVFQRVHVCVSQSVIENLHAQSQYCIATSMKLGKVEK